MNFEKLLPVILQAQKGNAAAQSSLMEEIQQDVYYFCKKLLKNEQDAEDATQDILITVLTKLDTLKEPAAFKGWLRRICSNRCKNKLTRRPKEAQIPEDEEGNSLLDTFEDMDSTVIPQEALENTETKRIIREIVDELPPAQTECILMFYYDSMSVKDIAAALSVPENTVKSRLNYGRKTIKEGIETAEKRDGIKLHGIAPLALLRPFFQSEAASTALEASKAAAMVKAAVEAGEAAKVVASAGITGTSAAATTTASTVASGVAAGVAKGISVKVIAAVIVGFVAVSGVGAFVGTQLAAWNQENSPAVASLPESSEPVEEAVVPTASPTTAPTPSPTPSPTPTPTPTPSPTPAPEPVPVELSEEEQAKLTSFFNRFIWYGSNSTYDWRNPMDGAEDNRWGGRIAQRENILQGVLYWLSIVDFSLYPGENLNVNASGNSFYDSSVPYRYTATQIDWILQNIFNCSETTIDLLRDSLTDSEDYEFEDDMYYCLSDRQGFGGGPVVGISKVETFRGYYYVNWGQRFNDVGSPSVEIGTNYAVMSLKETDGQTYWSLYYSSLEPFTDWDALP